jgi:predicted RNase H-like HicB family nuclease
VWNIREKEGIMERIVTIHVEKLPEGFYLATSEQIQGLVAQGRTVSETLEIARDVARKLLEATTGGEKESCLPAVAESFEYQMVVGS